MTLLSTPSHPCDIRYEPGGQRCPYPAYRRSKLSDRWLCRKHTRWERERAERIHGSTVDLSRLGR